MIIFKKAKKEAAFRQLINIVRIESRVFQSRRMQSSKTLTVIVRQPTKRQLFKNIN